MFERRADSVPGKTSKVRRQGSMQFSARSRLRREGKIRDADNVQVRVRFRNRSASLRRALDDRRHAGRRRRSVGRRHGSNAGRVIPNQEINAGPERGLEMRSPVARAAPDAIHAKETATQTSFAARPPTNKPRTAAATIQRRNQTTRALGAVRFNRRPSSTSAPVVR